MDIKIAGNQPRDHARSARSRPGVGARNILAEMQKALERFRAPSSVSIPAHRSEQIPSDKNPPKSSAPAARSSARSWEKTGAKGEYEDDGTVKIASADGKSIAAAKKLESAQSVAEPEKDEIYYEGKVVQGVEFGAFVETVFVRATPWSHISRLCHRKRGRKGSRCGTKGRRYREVKFLGHG